MWKRLSLVLALLPASASAHDFWLSLDRYRIAPGGAVAASFLVGEASAAEPWTYRPERVVSLRSMGPEGLRDHSAELTGQGSHLRFSDSGTHVLAFETTPALSVLPPERFAPYVADEKLTLVAAHRLTRMATPGRELYARRAKAVIQVGSILSDAPLRPLGLSLELIPVTHPLAPRTGPLTFTLLYRGKPLGGAKVECIRLDRPMPVQQRTSDAEGRSSCAIPSEGRWLIGSIWSVPIADTRQADYDTLFTSLTFGYD